MKVARITFNLFGVNTYIVYDPDSLEAAIVDPGMTTDKEREALDRFVAGYKVTQLINTHMHLDHIFGNAYVMRRYGLPVKAAQEDDFLGKTLDAQARMFGQRVEVENHGVDVALADGDRSTIGKEYLQVIAVPGHSPGGIALYCPTSGFVLTGDSLFKGSIGRTDLAGGDHATLISSIRNRLLTLPDDTLVLPGHGDVTTIGDEKRSNPYL